MHPRSRGEGGWLNAPKVVWNWTSCSTLIYYTISHYTVDEYTGIVLLLISYYVSSNNLVQRCFAAGSLVIKWLLKYAVTEQHDLRAALEISLTRLKLIAFSLWFIVTTLQNFSICPNMLFNFIYVLCAVKAVCICYIIRFYASFFSVKANQPAAEEFSFSFWQCKIRTKNLLPQVNCNVWKVDLLCRSWMNPFFVSCVPNIKRRKINS